jgi:aspartate-semialdehyde dehydrogenase
MTVLVGILGATGMVGQRFITLLNDHPYLKVAALGASPKSAGKTYKNATDKSWKMTSPIPQDIAPMMVHTCDPSNFKMCKIIFSGLDADVAGDIEMNFVKSDFVVFSNAKNHRMNPIVPLMVPLVNTHHFDIIPHQKKVFGCKNGFLVTNANCSTTGLVVVLAALTNSFGPLSRVIVVTMQAISGSGYPGISSLDILGNVIPYISGEEEKIEVEVGKILGSFDKEKSEFVPHQPLKVSASCNRVPVIDGHTEVVSRLILECVY